LSEPPALTVAGRTAAGVHARGQVAHVDLESGVDPEELQRRLARLLPDDVVVRSVTRAAEGFDARFSAVSRRYAYRVADGVDDPLRRGWVLSWPRPLDLAALQEASEPLVGEHDFAAYCRRREGATTTRELLRFAWSRDGGLLTAQVEADAFCHSMVRSLVGALLVVGEGRRPSGWPREVLDARVRNSAVQVAPPHGLVLEEVRYPPDDQMGARATETRRHRGPLLL
jgi:tRNA pseudouridine38-40 synthase